MNDNMTLGDVKAESEKMGQTIHQAISLFIEKTGVVPLIRVDITEIPIRCGKDIHFKLNIELKL